MSTIQARTLAHDRKEVLSINLSFFFLHSDTLIYFLSEEKEEENEEKNKTDICIINALPVN